MAVYRSSLEAWRRRGQDIASTIVSPTQPQVSLASPHLASAHISASDEDVAKSSAHTRFAARFVRQRGWAHGNLLKIMPSISAHILKCRHIESCEKWQQNISSRSNQQRWTSGSFYPGASHLDNGAHRSQDRTVDDAA